MFGYPSSVGHCQLKQVTIYILTTFKLLKSVSKGFLRLAAAVAAQWFEELSVRRCDWLNSNAKVRQLDRTASYDGPHMTSYYVKGFRL